MISDFHSALDFLDLLDSPDLLCQFTLWPTHMYFLEILFDVNLFGSFRTCGRVEPLDKLRRGTSHKTEVVAYLWQSTPDWSLQCLASMYFSFSMLKLGGKNIKYDQKDEQILCYQGSNMIKYRTNNDEIQGTKYDVSGDPLCVMFPEPSHNGARGDHPVSKPLQSI